MKAVFYGTRGSCPVASSKTVHSGGNTTCVRIDSPCLPAGMWFVIDAGTGILPLGQDFLKGQGREATIVFSHWHHDHTQGFPLSVFPYLKQVPVHLWGPYEHNIGPRQVFERLMEPPFFPVHFREVGSHIHAHNVEFPNSTIMLVHPQGGVRTIQKDEYERLVAEGRQLPFKKRDAFNVEECLVVRMHRSNHPEHTISLRFEEGPTKKVLAFVTDHENQAGIPISFRQHLAGADLLVMDCQYTREKYDQMTCGWGHGTPDYVANVAREVGAKAVGLTHHDPSSDDELIARISQTAEEYLAGSGIPVRPCLDYQEFTI